MRLLIAVESSVVVMLLLAILGIVAIQIVSRYVLNAPTRWTEEVGQLTLMWLVFMSAALVMAQDRHVTVRVLGRALGARGRRLLAIFAHLAVIVAGTVFVWAGFGTTVTRMQLPLPATRWPAGLPFIGSLIGFSLMVLHAALNLWVVLRGGFEELPEDVDEAGI